MKKFFFLALLALLFSQCNILENDPLPTPSSPDPFQVSGDHVMLVLAGKSNYINVAALLAGKIDAHKIQYLKQPEFGKLSVIDNNLIKYEPAADKSSYEERIVFKNPSNTDSVALDVVVRPRSSDFCNKIQQFKPVYLSNPISYKIKSGESLKYNITDLFCEFDSSIKVDQSVHTSGHPEIKESEGLSIHIGSTSTESFAQLEINPKKGFTGKQGMVFELCYDYNEASCPGATIPSKCPNYPQFCRYFLYAVVEVEVTE